MSSRPFPVPSGTSLLGEIITWTCGGVSIQHLDLIDALRATDLDEAVARELAPRHAFSRACKKLAQDRIIRQVSESESVITFQFTSERREGTHFEYKLETLLTLEKATGRVSCPLASLATRAQEELDRCIQTRTGSDVTRIVQKLFERQADLFPIRTQGGAYFVPREHTDFLDRIQRFVGRLNGQLLRFPIPAGTGHGDKSVKEAVRSGLAALIEEHREAVATFGEDTREATLQRAAERIVQVRYKVQAYAAYLQEERERLESDLAEAARELRRKVEQLQPTTASPALVPA